MRPQAVDYRHQRGVTMFEVLVTLGIITVWLLATAGVQSSSAKLNKTAQFRTQAVVLASEIAERMENNAQTAINGGYGCNPCSLTTTPSGCIGAPCIGPDRAIFDLAEWGQRVAAVLPNPTATIVVTTAGNPVTYTITMTWDDRREKRTYDAAMVSTNANVETLTYQTIRTIMFDPG